ncbi:MAG: flagellar assembly peptidoglycan hydrolase FlgJ [Methylophilaceae bacterium]
MKADISAISQDQLPGSLALDANGLGKLRQAAQQGSPQALKATATQFEAMFLNMMLKSMRDATVDGGLFDSEQTKTYTSMLDQQVSQTLASRGIGLADALTRQLSNRAVVSAHAVTGNTVPVKPEAAASSSVPAEVVASSSAPALRTQAPGHVKVFQQQVAVHAEAASRETGIPANFIVGQAALESNWGRREIKGKDGATSYNLFGIKATASWKGKVVEALTSEYVSGVRQQRIEKFRAYDSYADSFRDFANMLQKNTRYEPLIANAQNATAYAQAMQKAGYATDPNYADKLRQVIQQVSTA